MEQLSVGFITLVAGRAGVNMTGPHVHDYGVDGTFMSVKVRERRRVDSGIGLQYQLKATYNWKEDNGHIVYRCEGKTYNDVVDRAASNGVTPLVLLVLCLPRSEADWLQIGAERLVLRRCCYWMICQGDATTQGSVRIRIPVAQCFDANALQEMFARLEKGQSI